MPATVDVPKEQALTPQQQRIHDVQTLHKTRVGKKIDRTAALAFYRAQQAYLGRPEAPGLFEKMRSYAQRERSPQGLEAAPTPHRTKADLDALTSQYMGVLGLDKIAISEAKTSWMKSGGVYALGPMLMNIASTAGAWKLIGTALEELETKPYWPRASYLIAQTLTAGLTAPVNSVMQLFFVALQELIADRQSNRVPELKAPGYAKTTKSLQENNEAMANLEKRLTDAEKTAREALAGNVDDGKREAAIESLLQALEDVTSCIQTHDEQSTKVAIRRSVIDLNFTGQRFQGYVRAGVVLGMFGAIAAGRATGNAHVFAKGQVLARFAGMAAHVPAAMTDVSNKFQATWAASALATDFLTKTAREELKDGKKDHSTITEDDIDIRRITIEEKPVRWNTSAQLEQVKEQLILAKKSFRQKVHGGVSVGEYKEYSDLRAKQPEYQRDASAVRTGEVKDLRDLEAKQRKAKQESKKLNTTDADRLQELERGRMNVLHARIAPVAPHDLRELHAGLAEVNRLEADLAVLDGDDWTRASPQTLDSLDAAVAQDGVTARVKTAFRTAVARTATPSEILSQVAQRFGSSNQMIVLGPNMLLIIAGIMSLMNAKRTENGEPPIPDAVRFAATAPLVLMSVAISLLYGYLVNSKVSQRIELRNAAEKNPELGRVGFRPDLTGLQLRLIGRSMFAIPNGLNEARRVNAAQREGSALKQRLLDVQATIEATPLLQEAMERLRQTEVKEAAQAGQPAVPASPGTGDPDEIAPVVPKA